MKVLIAGANGFIGREVADTFAAKGDEVVRGVRTMPDGADLDNYRQIDLSDVSELSHVIEETKPDVVINCAGIVDPNGDVSANVQYTSNLFDAIENSGTKVGQVVVCSSAGVYGQVSPDRLPVTEEMPLNGDSPYAKSKIEEEQIALEKGNDNGPRAVVVRVFNPIGAGGPPRLITSGILRQLDAIKSGEQEPVVKIGHSEDSRDYLSTEVVAGGIYAVVHGDPKREIYNIGSGHSTTNGELARLIIQQYDIDPKPAIENVNPQPGPVVASQADVSRLQELGWQPPAREDLEETVKKLVKQHAEGK